MAAHHANRTGPAIVRVTALALLLVACGEDASGQRRAELPREDRALEARMEDAYRVGGVEGTGWAAFSRIRDVAFDGAGRLYLLDAGATGLLVLAADGSLHGRLGGEGGGPGEFRAPVGMAVAGDGTVAVLDLGSRSLAVFGPAGEYRRNVRVDGSQGRVGRFRLDGRGGVVWTPPLVWTGSTGSSVVEPAIPRDGGVIEDPAGIPLLRAPLEDGGGAQVLGWSWIPPREGDRGVPRNTAFIPELHWALLPDGAVAVADTLAYQLRIIGGEGTVLLRRDIQPREPLRAEREAELDRRAEESGRGGGGAAAGVGRTPEEAARTIRQVRRRLETELAFFTPLQVIRGLRSDPEGRLWIERVGRDASVPGPVDVVTGDGRYLGTLAEGTFSLPAAFGPGGLAVWLSTDALDVPVVTVRRVHLQ